jgi:hypothetical protein
MWLDTSRFAQRRPRSSIIPRSTSRSRVWDKITLPILSIPTSPAAYVDALHTNSPHVDVRNPGNVL